ncbi:MAG: sigma-54-dependent Fis family transcriptional regulator [Planctomycetes bacterium]|nr:sigma-54-dependent Fis family transcriptional regulator [Planctomycetota bacterium]
MNPQTAERSTTNGIRVVVVDDEANFRRIIGHELDEAGFEVTLLADGRDLCEHLAQRRTHVVLLDIRMPNVDGVELLKEIKERDLPGQVIMMTGHATVDLAIESMKAGAYDFLMKPCSIQQVEVSIQRAYEHEMLLRDHRDLRDSIALQDEARRMVGISPSMEELRDLIQRVAPSPVHVLVQGESGVGKEIVARMIHALSPRHDRPFVALNCATLQSDLAASTLFGFEKGAFTGAGERKRGLFEVADRGTLFLDEIGELDTGFQALLLRAIQFGEIRRVGGEKPISVDVRVIAATNADLVERCSEGRFREDLYYRISTVSLGVPPLRQRREDIPALVEHFLNGRDIEVTEEAMRRLMAYDWPGNVRELQNALDRMLLFAPQKRIEAPTVDRHLLQGIANRELVQDVVIGDSLVTLEEIERRHLLGILERFDGNKKRAAECLGVSLKTIYNKLERYRENPK